jgi:hypothetical protein
VSNRPPKQIQIAHYPFDPLVALEDGREQRPVRGNDYGQFSEGRVVDCSVGTARS